MKHLKHQLQRTSAGGSDGNWEEGRILLCLCSCTVHALGRLASLVLSQPGRGPLTVAMGGAGVPVCPVVEALSVSLSENRSLSW